MTDGTIDEMNIAWCHQFDRNRRKKKPCPVLKYGVVPVPPIVPMYGVIVVEDTK
ncbi:hypothetical protein SAMN02910340_01629 [Methanosarcina thermophila]|jgi:hypothetical protein|uniref:Uncharacterized protein n=1 Tax=Methanosarcina thermophila TaxID=2210 RepID=A0A1I6ZSI1_METTE|nr:hypothetical protein [Methanosarcina thermophila]NLU58073.1 hypothetical protein [Methanosarcina thermophila]SFT65612.1 hypothetical protein SAMN02910340_01629 [Methanosarcina thermophila]BAW30099.1 hypothetical protein MESMT1_2169 [Methanosarcina thermophila]GLI15532.1 hypothetical protein MTHERMMSTA1_26580 [Methanosarcina thermophila MST-A1]HOA69657.1 hypothetical protein [Methanosarcina thermophila]